MDKDLFYVICRRARITFFFSVARAEAGLVDNSWPGFPGAIQAGPLT